MGGCSCGAARRLASSPLALLLLLLVASSGFAAATPATRLLSAALGGSSGTNQQQLSPERTQTLTRLVAHSLRRQLLQSARCPAGCTSTGCVSDATTAGLRCNKCMNNLLVNKANGNCSCPAGKYTLAPESCTDCPRGSYCPGADYSVAKPPAKFECPGNMTTLGLRATSARACVNMPGYSYNVDLVSGVPSATLCPADTYSAGLKKQRACVPCVSGFSTNGLTGRTSPNACIVPAGSFLKAPGQVVPCPKGEWKSGVSSNASCTKCAFGVTTAAEGAISETECKVLLPSYFAAAMTGTIITRVKICPQKYYCPGGVPKGAFNPNAPGLLSDAELTIKLCPNGQWTQELGSTAREQCMTPPGYKTADGATVMCADGSYRADWKASGATACTPCGEGVKATRTDQLVQYDLVSEQPVNLNITTSPEDCYIMPGQGLYYNTLTASWRARNCDGNGYGVANQTYGLTPYACRDCPANMVARNTSDYPNSRRYYVRNGDGTGGFVDPMACVTQAGYGYDGRLAQKCEPGYYNDKDTYTKCSPCRYGYSTRGAGVGVTVADCLVAPGFGYHESHNYSYVTPYHEVLPCPLGYYNAEFQTNYQTPCTQCPNGTTTIYTGSKELSDCSLCLPGWGGPDCATQCGGYGANASYGVGTRPYGTPCTLCTSADTSFSFEFNLQNDLYTPLVAARMGADSAADCLSQFAQIVDGPWYLPINTNQSTRTFPGINTFAACVDLCTAGPPACQFITYDYKLKECMVQYATEADIVGAPYVAFKGMPAGGVGASKLRTHARKADYGLYTIYQDPMANYIGVQKAPAAADALGRMQDCVTLCEDDPKCAGLTIQSMVFTGAVNTVSPTSCKLIYGVSKLGVFKRTVTRMDPVKLEIPVYMRTCRDLPEPVHKGAWFKSCRGTPVNGFCMARCDCNLDECYVRDRCPITVCQEDGLWGPFNAPTCELAIPSQPAPISCGVTLRPNNYNSQWSSRRRRARALLQASESLGNTSLSSNDTDASGNGTLPSPSPSPSPVIPGVPEEVIKAVMQSPRAQGAREAAKRFTAAGGAVGARSRRKRSRQNSRNLLAEPSLNVFSPPVEWVAAGHALCPAKPLSDPQYPWLGPDYEDAIYGLMVHDHWACEGHPVEPIYGIAATDFDKKGIQNKFEQRPKTDYESYVWSYFNTPPMPYVDQLVSYVQGMEIMVVGNVGVDHPCWVNCAVTEVDIAIYEADITSPTKEPKMDQPPIFDSHVLLPLNSTFKWSTNESAMLHFDIQDFAYPATLLDDTAYWLRIKITAPFNGSEVQPGWSAVNEGLGRCYAFLATKNALKYPDAPTRWQEAGGFNTTCTGAEISTATAPDATQTIGSCVNGGAPGAVDTGYCEGMVTNRTCGTSYPISCPVQSQDIVFGFYGFQWSNDGPGG